MSKVPAVFADLKMETEADPDVLPRLLMAIDGPQKGGKTHFALTAPGPIGILNIDNGLEGVVEKFYDKGKTIGVKKVTLPEKLTQESAIICYKDCSRLLRSAR
jgi:hypothetical protein